jgi:hypothetical protein
MRKPAIAGIFGQHSAGKNAANPILKRIENHGWDEA